MKSPRLDTQPWWKEPWPWILMAGPAAAMIGCFVTIFLAVTNADQPVDHRKRGLVIERNLPIAPPAKPELSISLPAPGAAATATGLGR